MDLSPLFCVLFVSALRIASVSCYTRCARGPPKTGSAPQSIDSGYPSKSGYPSDSG